MEAPVILVVGAVSNRVRDELQTVATVQTVETATDAERIIASDTPGLVLTRQALPATTGIALAETIAERWHHVPVVLATTEGSEALASQAVTADVAAYCSYEETIDPVDLVGRVEDILTSVTADTPAANVVDRMTDGFFALDASYRFTYLNERARKRFEEALGHELTPGALRGRAFEAVVDDDPTFIERFREAMNTQEPVTFEAAYAPLEQVFELRVFPAESGLSVYFRNVTERRRRETALEEERALTESVLAALPDALYVFDAEGQFLRWNETFSTVTGYDDTAIAEMVPADFIADPDVDAVETAIAGVFENGDTVTVEARFETADGAWIPHEFTGGPITDDDGQVTRLVGIGRDLTERKARKRRFQAVFDNTYQFTGLVDPDGTVVEANETALAFGGLDRSDVVGELVWTAPWFQTEEWVPDRVKTGIETARDGAFFREQLPAQGATRRAMLDFSVRPLTDQTGTVTQLIVEGRDITALQRREDHLRTLQRVLRHNLRNELTATRGYAELLEANLEDATYVEYAQQIREGADTLLALSETARDLTETVLEGGDPQPTDIVEQVEAAVAALETDIAVDTPETAIARADDRLEPVLREVLNAALKRADGTPDLAVDVRVGDEYVTIQLVDDGPTIPDIELTELRADAERSQLEHGNGLQLRLAKLTIEDYGGSITHRAGETGGNVLTIRVPAAGQLAAQ